jgi:hypothetical protein
MKLDCVLTAVNDNPLYIDFIPIFVNTWNKLYPGIDVKIILIAHHIPDKFIKYSNNIILFTPIDNISTCFISQYIRILYPAILNYKNGIMITDIDIIPMNETYFTKYIENLADDLFIYYRGEIDLKYNMIAICYNVALAKTWGEIFHIQSLDDIKSHLIKKSKEITYIEGHGNIGWNTDQLELYKHVMDWNKKTNKYFKLYDKDVQYNRLDRHTFNINNKNINIIKAIKNHRYSDYHLHRPYTQYEHIHNIIFNSL